MIPDKTLTAVAELQRSGVTLAVEGRGLLRLLATGLLLVLAAFGIALFAWLGAWALPVIALYATGAVALALLCLRAELAAGAKAAMVTFVPMISISVLLAAGHSLGVI